MSGETRRRDAAARAGGGPEAERAEVLAAFSVPAETAERLDRYLALLETWQVKTNLVAPSTVPHVWTRHVADSLQLLPLAPAARTWLDLGSGAGFPGMVIACALAGQGDAAVHLVESNGKKCAFMREAARVTGAPAHVHCMRIEDYVDSCGNRFDVVTARALAPLKTLLGYAAPVLEKGAQGLFLKGQDVDAELTDAAKYWNVEASLVASRTDPQGRVVLIKRLARAT